MAFEGFNFGGMRNMFQQAQVQRSNSVSNVAPTAPQPSVAPAVMAPVARQFSDASNAVGGLLPGAGQGAPPIAAKPTPIAPTQPPSVGIEPPCGNHQAR